MNGGYVMVDAKGLSFTSTSPQTLPGIHTELKKAVLTGKPVFMYNCDYDIYPIKTPIPASLTYSDVTSERITVYVPGYTATVAKTDLCLKSRL